MLLLFLLSLVTASAEADVACYECHGQSVTPESNSTGRGQLCSIDKLCLGESCYFNVSQTGDWSAGCSDREVAPALVCSQNNTETTCTCQSNLCNQFKTVNETLLHFWESQSDSAFSSVSLVLPDLSVSCIECGNVTVNNRSLWVPCADKHICRGDYCVTKRGLNPHSYCGSLWDGSDEELCLKRAGEEETCVCKSNMCNVVLSPEAMEAMMRPTTTTRTTPPTTTYHTTTNAITPIITTKVPENAPTVSTLTTKPSTSQAPSVPTTPANTTDAIPTEATSATTPKKTRKCKNTMKFSPNAQAVLMGQKLGQMINGGFGSDNKGVQEFKDGVDTHICNYE